MQLTFKHGSVTSLVQGIELSLESETVQDYNCYGCRQKVTATKTNRLRTLPVVLTLYSEVRVSKQLKTSLWKRAKDIVFYAKFAPNGKERDKRLPGPHALDRAKFLPEDLREPAWVSKN